MSTPTETCCGIGEQHVTSLVQPRDRGPAPCPACGAAGAAVKTRTLLHQLRPVQTERLGHWEYRYCDAPDCDTVYYSIDGEVVFGTADLRQRVGIKGAGDPTALVCYCFGFTVGDLDADVAAAQTATSGRIRALVKARACACEVRNPSGRCCLGEISRISRRSNSEEGKRS